MERDPRNGNFNDGLNPLGDTLAYLAAGEPDYDEGFSRAFSGDFYREEDNVVRGVSMLPGDLGEHGQFVDGDFYHDNDGFCKGHGFKDFQLGDAAFGGGAAAFDLPGADKNFMFDFPLPKCLQPNDGPNKTQFSTDDKPPKRPDNAHFKYEATTIFLTGVATPSAIGNDVMRFLREGVVSSVTKVSQRKYSFKADIFDSSGVMCTVKLRVYQDGEQKYAVEFQRRCGDGPAFNSAYRKAKAFLEPLYGSGSDAMPEQARPEIPQMKDAPPLDANDLTPLLDMAQQERPMQAEAAVALASIAQDDATAHLLFANGDSVETLRTLLTSKHADVAYPTACALKHLASRSEANREVSQYKRSIKQVYSESSCPIVQDELSKVLSLVGDDTDQLYTVSAP